MKYFELSLSLLIISSLVFTCRRDNDLRYEKLNPEQRFFTIPKNADLRIRAIADKIFQQNQRYGFVNSLVSRVGYPMWDKTNFGRSGAANNVRTTSQSTEYVYIPFVSEKGLSSILIVGLSSADTSYRLLYPEEYSAFDFNYTDTTKTNRRQHSRVEVCIDCSTIRFNCNFDK